MIDIDKPYEAINNRTGDANVKLHEIIYKGWPYLLIVALKSMMWILLIAFYFINCDYY